MSISEKLIRVNNAKETIQEALETPNEHIEEYHTLIEKYISNQPLSTSTGTCENALDVPCKEFVVEGNSYQESDPTPDEPIAIEVVKGKNLFDKDKIETYCSYTFGTIGVIPTKSNYQNRCALGPNNAIEIEPNTTYTFQGASGYRVAIAQLKSDKTSLGDTGWKTSSSIPYTITTSNEAKYIGLNLGNDDNSNMTTTQIEEMIDSIQLEKGSATTYLPYNTIEIEQRGKNLLDNNSMVLGDLNNETGQEDTSTTKQHYRSSYISVLPNTSYVFTTNYTYPSTGITKIMEYSNSKAFITRNSKSSVNQTIIFTTNSNTYYLRLCMYDSLTFNDFYSLENMLELGSTASSYEPYQEPQTYQIPLGENYLAKVGSVQDNLVISRNGKCKISKNISDVTLNGSENWHDVTQGYIISLFPSDRKTSVYNGYCSHFIVEKSSTTWTNLYYMGWNSGGTMWVRDDLKIGTNLATWKSWLSTNKPIVYYQLATPTEIELDNVEIDMFSGSNYFSIDTSMETDFEVTFVEDVDKKVEELENTILELGGEI